MTALEPGLAPAPPTGEAPSRAQRLRKPLLTIGGLGALTLALHLRDPHQQHSWGVCPLALIGVHCPGCGGLRAVNDLTHAQVGAALSSNLAFVVLLPFMVAGLGVWVLDAWRGTRTRLSPQATRVVAGTLLVLVAAFTVLRNLPIPLGTYLAP